jgi:hypothetical protein
MLLRNYFYNIILCIILYTTNSKFFCPISKSPPRHGRRGSVGSMLFFQLFTEEKYSGVCCVATGPIDYCGRSIKWCQALLRYLYQNGPFFPALPIVMRSVQKILRPPLVLCHWRFPPTLRLEDSLPRQGPQNSLRHSGDGNEPLLRARPHRAWWRSSIGTYRSGPTQRRTKHPCRVQLSALRHR